MNPHNKPQSRTASSEGLSGTQPPKDKSKATSGHTVRSVLIEPRENEPPRVSISVEYESKAPTMKQLKAAAMEAIHGVVSAKGYVDLGYRESQVKRTLTQTFSLEKEESK